MSDRWLVLLLTQAWQLTLVILVVAMLSRRIARKRPHLAVALWLIVLAKAITPPVWSSPVGVFSWTIPITATSQVEVERARSTSLPTAVSAPLPSPEPLPAPSTELISLPEEPEIAVLPFELASPTESTPQPIDVEPLRPARWSWSAAFLTVWLSGATLTLLIIFSRLLHLWRTLSRAGAGPDAELAGQVETLRRRLQLRRRVRVWVTPTDHGPAVLGLFRPWLLLPKTLVESVSPGDLEPLLAHELLHIRRGDLWIGWWQAAVQAAWWPHPLVWWSNRVLTRQLERCCDEEVLAELGCEPGRYARGLLKALELKHRLRPVPAAPGVRPVDLTAERMERIMRMGQGSRRRTPWWCWGVLGMGLLVALPGAGLKLGAEEPGQVLFGVGVNSEAGVTGTVILGEDDATPADAQEPATVISGKDSEVRADSIRLVANPGAMEYGTHCPMIFKHSPIQLAPRRGDPPQDPRGDLPWGTLHFEVHDPLTVEALKLKQGVSNGCMSSDLGLVVKMRAKQLGYPFAGVTLIPGTGESFRDTIFRVGHGPRATLVKPDSDDTDKHSDPAASVTLRYQTELPAESPPYAISSTIENDFRDFGYFSVKATAETVSAERRDYVVERGGEYLVRNVQFDAAIKVSKRELRDFLEIPLGERFFGDKIRSQAERLRLFLGLSHPVFSTWLAIPRMAGEQPVVDLIFVSHPELSKADWSRITTHPRQPSYADPTNPLHAWPHEAPVECRAGDKVYLYIASFSRPSSPYVLGARQRAKDPDDVNRYHHLFRNNAAIRLAEKLALEKQLEQPVTERFHEESFIGVVSMLCNRHGVALAVDQTALNAARIDYNHPVSGQFDEVPLGTALRTLVEPLGLSIAERAGVLTVTSPRLLLQTETRTYSVSSLLGDAATGSPVSQRQSLTLLADIIRSTIRPESWVERGGPASIQPYETTLSLVIRQTPEAHEDIASLFYSLRQHSNAQWPPRNAQERRLRHWRRIDRLIDISVKDKPLDQVLRRLCEDCQLKYVVDTAAIAEAGLDSAVRVTGEYQQVPLYRCVEKLCNATQGLTVEYHEDTLRLTTRRSYHQAIEYEVYPVADLVAPTVSPTKGWESLMQVGAPGRVPVSDDFRLALAIKANVDYLSWSEVGGPGDLKYYPATNVLAVRQTSRGHETLQRYFDELRKARPLKLELRTVQRTLTPAEIRDINLDGARVCLIARNVQGKVAPAEHRATLANGQSIESPENAALPTAEKLKLAPVIADNLRSIAITLHPSRPDGRFVPTFVNVPAGQTAFVDISDTLPASNPAVQNGKRIVLQITPRIVVVEEPEALTK